MNAYYNEFDPYAAQWLRNLIAKNLIPRGEVDERSITEVHPDDLRGFRQCHFFAGIGGWVLAARLAGWPDDRELWTGSPPCQPFSVAGKGKAQSDDRHLWPHYFRLISARRPVVCMGEQVAAAVGKDWLDGVLVDLEGIGYAGRAAVVPACAVNAPHRRDRLWFVARADNPRPQGQPWDELCPAQGRCEPAGSAASAGLLDRAEHPGIVVAHANSLAGRQGDQDAGRCTDGSGAREVAGLECASAGDVAHAVRTGSHASAHGGVCGGEESAGARHVGAARLCVSGGHWDNAGWIIGHDGKARRVEPSIRLLAHGVPGRVGRLRAYGNAIAPPLAAEIIGAYMDCYPT